MDKMSFDEKKLISKLMEMKQDLFDIVEKKYEEISKKIYGTYNTKG